MSRAAIRTAVQDSAFASVTLRRRSHDLKLIGRDRSGAAVIEFAMLTPIFLALLLGVLVMGIYLQNLNAMQSAANDTARQVMIFYQRENQLQAVEISSIARNVATQMPYGLETDRLGVSVAAASTSRVTGATEFNLELRYQLIGLPMVPIDWLTISYQRPIFVV